MPATNPIPPSEIVGTADERVVMYGVPWSHFEATRVYRLKGERYVQTSRSEALPDLDTALLAHLVGYED